jgi:hypothetical protein
MGLAEPLMTRDEYELAFPLLLAHVEVCPLAQEDARLVASERSFYAFDDSADVVLACKPDLATSRGDVLVLTEIKTSMQGGIDSPDDAFSSTLQVPVMLNMLAKGLTRTLGYAHGEVRLEYLTPANGRVWTWSTADPANVDAAASKLRAASAGWHNDHDWPTHPGAHCAWCPVRQWCPDRDVYLQPLSGEGDNPSGPVVLDDDEEPPF